jgi:hypothetical protein
MGKKHFTDEPIGFATRRRKPPTYEVGQLVGLETMRSSP